MKNRILYKLVEDQVFFHEESPYNTLKKEINRIDNKYFDKIQRDCEVLPEELHPGLRNQVVNDFRDLISSLLSDECMDSIVAKVRGNSVVHIGDEEIAVLRKNLSARGDAMQRAVVTLPFHDEEVESLYEDAKRRTIGERIMQSNKDDVIRFHHVLQDNTERHVRQLVDVEMGKFLCRLAERF